MGTLTHAQLASFRRPADAPPLRPWPNALVAVLFGPAAVTTCQGRLAAADSTLLGAAVHLAAARTLLATLFSPTHVERGARLAAAVAEADGEVLDGKQCPCA